jgi:hypothetical protein
MNWASRDGKLNPETAARAFVAECFEGRELDRATLRGSWHHGATFGVWTFSLVDGVKVYELRCDANGWRVAESKMSRTA